MSTTPTPAATFNQGIAPDIDPNAKPNPKSSSNWSRINGNVGFR